MWEETKDCMQCLNLFGACGYTQNFTPSMFSHKFTGFAHTSICTHSTRRGILIQLAAHVATMWFITDINHACSNRTFYISVWAVLSKNHKLPCYFIKCLGLHWLFIVLIKEPAQCLMSNTEMSEQSLMNWMLWCKHCALQVEPRCRTAMNLHSMCTLSYTFESVWQPGQRKRSHPTYVLPYETASVLSSWPYGPLINIQMITLHELFHTVRGHCIHCKLSYPWYSEVADTWNTGTGWLACTVHIFWNSGSILTR